FPAFALTAFDPVRVLKGNLGSRTGKNVLRKVMVLIQFTISTFMIISVIVILRQMDYIINKDLGYDTDRIMILSSRGHGENILRDPIRQIPGVESVSFSFGIPGIQPGSDVFSLEGGAQDETHRTEVYHGDYDFINTYGLEIIRGRDFSREYSTDNTKIIINEKAVPLFGNMEDIIGKTLINVSRNNSAWEIIGVVKDFHYVNLKTEIHPLVMHLNNEWYQSISVRVRREDLSNTISSLRTAFSETVQNQEFDYYLLEDDLRNKYPEEDKVREVFIYFGILAILIAALGLFGLASISIQQRTKEIGIRKVLGASIGKVSGSLIKEFSIWILGANLIAWPIGYFFMDRWLQNFAYRIDFSMWFFILSGIVTFVIAVFTVSYQSIKVAKANPVDSLRYE
ncbi:MAG: FtsX-like permease family protein, partial [bacterium]|nr:FtsX-like permease family protein [bacterium]